MERVLFEKLEELDYGMTEAMRSLRTNISFCGDKIHSILITSTVPDEGKSSISMNLARAMAEDGKKVLLIDADMRKSVLVGRHGLHKEGKGAIYGLSHYLTGQKKLEEVVYETNCEGVDLVISGPTVPNPTEILGNQYFDEMMEKLEAQYDMILVDGPPVGLVIDSAVIASKCNGVIMVVEQGNVSRRFVQSAKKQLETSGAKILGAVLNKVKKNSTGYYKEYYKAYYGDTSGESEKKGE